MSVNGVLSDITGDPFLQPAPIYRLGLFNADVIATIMTLIVDTREQTSGIGIDFTGSGERSFATYGAQMTFSQTQDTTAFLCFSSCRGENPRRSGANERYTVTDVSVEVGNVALALTELQGAPEKRRTRIRAFLDLLRSARDLLLRH